MKLASRGSWADINTVGGNSTWKSFCFSSCAIFERIPWFLYLTKKKASQICKGKKIRITQANKVNHELCCAINFNLHKLNFYLPKLNLNLHKLKQLVIFL